jgi:hypothetical protein
MQSARAMLGVFVIGAVFTLTAHAVLEAVDVKTAHDKAFDFKPMKTWGWNPGGAGHVKMARTKDDDSESMQKRVDPLIRKAVAEEMAKRGLKETASNPDLMVTYYLLLTVNVETQQFGQFVPTAVVWEVPLFTTATQSFKVLNRGSLVLDMASKNAKDKDGVVWRGVAEAQLEPDASPQKRESKLKEAVRDLIRKYPPK